MLTLYLSLIETAEDRRLFERIYEKYRVDMYKYAYVLLHDERDAEDVVQNVFLTIIKRGVDKLRDLEGQDRLWVYLSVAVRNQCSAFAKKRGMRMAMEQEYNDHRGVKTNDALPPEEANYQFLVNAIRSLPPTYADVLYYALVQEMKAPEIAKLLKLEPAAVRQRISRGRRELIKLLGEDHIT